MGPPPSPKEPRRSGRRPAPSSSKSPAGSPPSEANPKSKDNTARASLNANHSNGRNKRAKNEEFDEPLEEPHPARNGVTTNGGSVRTKRKGKEKDKIPLSLLIPSDDIDGNPDDAGDGATGETGDGEEEGGITRCICQKYGTCRRVDHPRTCEEDPDQAEFMVQCEICKAWQHGQCMHYDALESVPVLYYCEECRPELWAHVVRDWASKHTRHSSSHSHPPPTPTLVHAPRNSRSHSPAISKTTKRRNTMNSRDAAYDEEKYQALIEASKADYGAKADYDLPPRTPISAVSAQGGLNGHADQENDPEPPANPKKKRKRTEDDAASVKRTRSASVTSDRPPPSVLARDVTPLNVPKGPPGPPSTASTVRATNTRKRTGGRKSQAQDVASVDGDEVPSAATTRKSNNRAKANNAAEHSNRRTQAHAGGSGGSAAASRAYHQSHAYAVSQQSLFTSWNLPDYLAHLDSMLPTDVPRPLEVRGSVLDGNSRESQERTTERGVKVKWPSKRMSVGDMNKRVRSLVEWVGREQAAAMERTRRKEALEKAVHAQQSAAAEDGLMNVDAGVVDGAHPVENGTAPAAPLAVSGSGEESTMKMMEELMEELINFQERFGPGAKAKERDRRAGTL
ncbi:hypothetical protein L227DRAFT_594636 [Lentinus tigrinus ALCF2SS1-6]|uniref:Zinc finger PHD-type domain-containing protein n=1 Tax=Lentinus tigrinus ALCF2SS1-6 TaxID=1328759 RepID=A0A5C2S241_9APHY|nr:hypothetical protein L227DRAFT_594636 [Lentinus tigrinus ALCF2SS1-6]